ncbi:hypothetical protein GCM10023155_50750 [Bremerella cremea]
MCVVHIFPFWGDEHAAFWIDHKIGEVVIRLTASLYFVGPPLALIASLATNPANQASGMGGVTRSPVTWL